MAGIRVKQFGLPKYVYQRESKGFQSYWWEKGKLLCAGTYSTPEEAEYKALTAKQGNHWRGMQDGPYFGFTYLISNKKTGKKYVGCKQFYLWDGPSGGYKCTDPSSPLWDPKAWKRNDWEFYTGSCIPLNEEIAKGNVWDYEFHVLDMCKSKLELHTSELKYMMEWDVLNALDEKGEYAFWNMNIASLEFRAPFKHSDVEAARSLSEDAARRYYLKPTYCTCGRVIPFGLRCACS